MSLMEQGSPAGSSGREMNDKVSVAQGAGVTADVPRRKGPSRDWSGDARHDARSREKVGEIDLKGHPEGFELEPSGERAFVNVPDARGIAVLDRASSRQIATWTVPQATGNFPMAIRQRGTEMLVGFRRPARVAIVDTRSGNLRAITPSCDDSDDIFVDEKRSRAYVSCGQGFIDVLPTR